MTKRSSIGEARALKRAVQAARLPPLETAQLGEKLTAFLERDLLDSHGRAVLLTAANRPVKLGSVKWGVYAFYDYDDKPIYVGQTRESLRTRIRRHLTNQRTDAVAMSVLDPFEVRKVRVWPLPELQGVKKADGAAWREGLKRLSAVERRIYDEIGVLDGQVMILNEKDPPNVELAGVMPASYEGEIVSEAVLVLRGHSDARIARRAATLAKLAQVVSERELRTTGLRRALLVQAQRIATLAVRRFEETGGQSFVATADASKAEDQGDV